MSEIKMQEVESSTIKAIGFDKIEKVIRVEFRSNGNVYDYKGVDEELFKQFLMAESKGRFLRTYIAKIYPYIKVVRSEK